MRFQIPFLSRWHPVLALRYLPMVQCIREYTDPVVVEIGSGGLGIGPYLKQPFVGVDLTFDPPLSPHLTPLNGSALDIPLKSEFADVVVSSDMLEHIPATKRQQAINELFRISKKCIIIGVPIGKMASKQDKELDTLFRHVHHQPHPFLAEHVTNGLPEQSDIEAYIAASAKKYNRQYHLTVIPNQNLSLRRWLMEGWVSQNLLVNIFFRKILLLAIPLMRHLNQPPTYRLLFVIRIKSVATM